jgi:hypothetical protein
MGALLTGEWLDALILTDDGSMTVVASGPFDCHSGLREFRAVKLAFDWLAGS